MKQTGVVEAVVGSEVRVRIRRMSACGGNCAGCSGNCNAGTLIVNAENRVGAKPGDTVELEMPSGRVLKTAAWVYLVPLLFLILGDILFNRLFHREWAAVLGGLGMMGVVYLVMIYFSRKNKDKYRLVVEKIV